MNEEKKPDDKRIVVEELDEYARTQPEPPGTGSRWLRGCGIALGIAALVFLFVVGACFISLARW